MQFFILKALQGDMKTLTIARSKLTWVKTTLLKDFQEITQKYQVPVTPNINPNRQDQVYDINGCEFAFFGLDYPQKLHGRKQDWVWLNEVIEIDKKSFDQLEMRTTKGMILDYNPSDDSHWVFNLQLRPDVTVIRSTQLDNPFLEQTIRNKIYSYDPANIINVQNGTADSYMWEVYGLGKKAKLEGAVFTNWDIVDTIPEDANYRGNGLDFGYTNDPTSLVELYTMDNEIFLNQLIYETKMLNVDIANRMNDLKVSKSATIFADSAEPKSIDELVKYGFNVKAVDKGNDSINFGIDIMKGYKIHITKKSIDLENELRKYKWSEDKNGKALNKPIDDFNHAIDASRYICMMVLGKKPTIAINWI